MLIGTQWLRFRGIFPSFLMTFRRGMKAVVRIGKMNLERLNLFPSKQVLTCTNKFKDLMIIKTIRINIVVAFVTLFFTIRTSF